jgi:hypothetical protein
MESTKQPQRKNRVATRRLSWKSFANIRDGGDRQSLIYSGRACLGALFIVYKSICDAMIISTTLSSIFYFYFGLFCTMVLVINLAYYCLIAYCNAVIYSIIFLQEVIANYSTLSWVEIHFLMIGIALYVKIQLAILSAVYWLFCCCRALFRRSRRRQAMQGIPAGYTMMPDGSVIRSELVENWIRTQLWIHRTRLDVAAPAA